MMLNQSYRGENKGEMVGPFPTRSDFEVDFMLAQTLLPQQLPMNGSVQQWSLGSVKRSEYRYPSAAFLWKECLRDSSHCLYNRARTASPAYSDFMHIIAKEPLCVAGCPNPSWVGEEELGREGLAVSTQSQDIEPFGKHATVTRRKVPPANDLVPLLRACAKNKDLRTGIAVHDDISKRGLLEKCSDALVIMYAKCGALTKAKELLDVYKSRDVCAWTALIAGYARQGQSHDALCCFEQMQREGLSPDAVTLSCILKACGSMKAADKGKQIHDEIAKRGLLRNDVVLGTALVDMYAKCGALAKAQCVLEELPFRNVVSWNSLITGYAQHGQGEQALNCFERMQHEGLSPNAGTFACTLKACGAIGAVEKGEQIHDQIVRQGLLGKDDVLGTALIDMYAKCGALLKAQQVLEEFPSRNVVSWSALIGGYAQQGQGEQALNCFERMQNEGLVPNAVTFACVLKACGAIGAVNKGEQIHDEIARHGLLGNVMLGNALVDMYAKCGDLAKAQQVLEELPSRNVVSWSALITGYAEQGQGEKALNCFERMQHEGLSPNTVTFASILKACGNIGALDKGKQIHDEIVRQGLLENNIMLGTALVDMYAKCGSLSKARQVLEELPSRDVVSWCALIAGCVQQGQGEQSLNCFDEMQHEGLSPDSVTFSCVLNACSHLGRVDDGHKYFVSMSTKYGLKPGLEHYISMVDLFGRAGHLDKAVRVIQEMPSPGFAAVWSALLGACWRWGDVNVGRWAFENAILIDKSDGSAYVLMANIYVGAGMQEAADNVEAMRKKNRAWKRPGCSCWIDTSGYVHAFLVGDTKQANISLEEMVHKMSHNRCSLGLHWVSPNIFDAEEKHLSF